MICGSVKIDTHKYTCICILMCTSLPRISQASAPQGNHNTQIWSAFIFRGLLSSASMQLRATSQNFGPEFWFVPCPPLSAPVPFGSPTLQQSEAFWNTRTPLSQTAEEALRCIFVAPMAKPASAHGAPMAFGSGRCDETGIRSLRLAQIQL